MISAFALERKFDLFDEYWQPKIIGEINDSHVKIAKVEGEFVWHHHENEDELFYVVKGRLEIQLRDQDALVLDPGDITIIPRGVEHRPVAQDETWIMMLEPKSTVNTGSATDSDKTIAEPEWI